MFEITTIGTTTIDTFLAIRDVVYTPPHDPRTPHCLGFPIGAKMPIQSIYEHFGGNAANVSVGLSRLKLKTAIVTSLYSFPPCTSILNNLKKNTVQTKFVKISSQGEANISYILDWQKHKEDRVVLSYHERKDFRKLTFPKTRWVYLASLGEYHTMVEKQLPFGTLIAWNPGGFEINKGLKFLLPLLKKTHILFVNKQEAHAIAGLHRMKNDIGFLFKTLAKTGPRVIVITCGKEGAYTQCNTSSSIYFEKSLPVPVQEVTGAGDAFSSGFLAAYLYKKPLQECLRWGMLNASFCIQKIGAQNGLLTLNGMKKKYRIWYRKQRAAFLL